MTNDSQKWYLKWWTVLVLLIAAGPFGFPLLWKSKDFNLFWKVLLTVVFIAVTIVAIWGSWKTVDLTVQKFKDAGLL